MHKSLSRFAIGTLAATIAVVLGWPGAPVLARSGESGASAEGRSLLGSYLAGRVARGQHDTSSAAEYYRKALMLDPDNDVLVEQAMIMDATEGRWEAALLLAEQLAKTQPTHRTARLLLGLSAAKAGRYLRSISLMAPSSPSGRNRICATTAR
jgi:hypothetical protein